MADTIYKTDDTTQETAPADGRAYTLAELQAIVGGLIELVYMPGDNARVMVVNEEGVLRDLPANWTATGLAGRPIVGDVLVCDDSAIR